MPPHPSTARARVALTLLSAAVLTGAAACSSSPATEPAASSATRVAPTPTATASAPAVAASTAPTAEPADPVEPRLEAGSVANGTQAGVSGQGSAEVAFRREGEIAVVVQVDCASCTGSVVVTAPGRMGPFGDVAAPASVSYLLDVLKDSAPEQSVIIRADGPWTATLLSWNDLPVVTGPQSGTGSAVLYLGDSAQQVEVTYTPAGPDDSFSGRFFAVDPNPFVFGDSVAFTEVVDLTLPGVLAIATDGTWSLSPVG